MGTKKPPTADKGWETADWRLPVAANMPVEVALEDGKLEVRTVVDGDWRGVRWWRSVEKGWRRKVV